MFVEGARTPFLSALTEFQTMMPHQLLAQAMAGLLARAGVQGNNNKLLLLSYLTSKYKISKPSFLVFSFGSGLRGGWHSQPGGEHR